MMTLEYNHSRKAFLIKDGGDELADVPFPFTDTNSSGNVFDVANIVNYNVTVYYKKDIPELDYHQVNVVTGSRGGHPKRLGWIIPVATLTTEDEDTLIKPYLCEYSFWAYCYLLSIEEIQNQIVFDDKSLVDILNALYPDGNLLIIEKKQMPTGITEKRYELSLARKGYYQRNSNYKNPIISVSLGETIKLLPAGEILKADNSYVNNYIEEFLSQHVYDTNSFIRFFFLYQIVEVLLDAEMVELLRDFANKLEQNQATYQVADKALQKNTESLRFARVVNNSGLKVGDYAALDNACNSFLGASTGKLLKNPESIYQVRNHIVHRFRKAATDKAAVKNICDYLELYLYDLLH